MHPTDHFTYILYSNSHSDPLREILLFLFYRWKNWDLEMLIIDKTEKCREVSLQIPS